MADALAQSAPLAQLLQRVRDSQARWGVVQADLPPALAGQVRPGPLDETGWTLLAHSGAAASKLRQSLPRLQARLAAAGWAELPIRVKVHVSQTG
jgi:Dna[CI] antecedent, DciA